jgi:hypothetical protein
MGAGEKILSDKYKPWLGRRVKKDKGKKKDRKSKKT